uniref:Uncharacterized protein n=1 Tax=Rhizophora mucronata TaxID=61149 RepID=A0A2P2P673_RHIMU
MMTLETTLVGSSLLCFCGFLDFVMLSDILQSHSNSFYFCARLAGVMSFVVRHH